MLPAFLPRNDSFWRAEPERVQLLPYPASGGVPCPKAKAERPKSAVQIATGGTLIAFLPRNDNF